MIKLGRDSGGIFMRWRFENVATRIVRNACDILGPNGDEKCGIRSKWLADCQRRNIKTLIGDYRDNRFNGLFEGSAQVFHHIDDILSLEKRLPANINLKVKSVILDLKDSRAVTMLQAFSLFFVKITEPYRQFTVSKNIQYLHLASEIQPMLTSLLEVESQPMILFNGDFTLGNLESISLQHQLHISAKTVRHPDRSDMLFQIIKKMAGACIKVVRLQLGDFLPGGDLSLPPTKSQLARTTGSGADNLTSERHFGSLDNSMKRRRHATLHHHSTILILKSQRRNLIGWLDRMSPKKKTELFRKARKEGKLLRRKHQEEIKAEMKREQEFLLEIEKKNEAGAKGSKKQKSTESSALSGTKQRKLEDPIFDLPTNEEVRAGQWIAVAYENGWYPGIVTQIADDQIQADFMHPTLRDGKFCWPSKSVTAIYDRKYIFRILKNHPCPVSGGRQFELPLAEFQHVQEDYEEYKKLYF